MIRISFGFLPKVYHSLVFLSKSTSHTGSQEKRERIPIGSNYETKCFLKKNEKEVAWMEGGQTELRIILLLRMNVETINKYRYVRISVSAYPQIAAISTDP